MRTMPAVCALLLATGLCAVSAHAQSSRAVAVSHSGSQIDVSVNRSTPLGTVLDEICRDSNAQCDGTEKATDVMVPAQQISGDWGLVLSRLLDGTDLNYATREPAGSSAAVLSITGIAQRTPDQPGLEGGSVARSEGTEDFAQPAFTADNVTTTSTTLSGDSAAEGTLKSETASMGSTPLLANNQTPPTSAAASAAQGAPAGAGGQGSMGTKPDRMLFGDNFGNPVPLSQSPQYLLFPDGGGNLIPVPSQASSSPYLLFPDSNGKPVPVSTQAPQYLLFPDGNGRLIPVQSGKN